MPDLIFEPAVSDADGFVQTIRLQGAEGEPVGFARWHVPQGVTDGVGQILDFQVLAPYRRRGQGKRLMLAVVSQVRAYHSARKLPLRRLWVPLRQKSHVIARAFFSSQGFSHVSTIKDLLTEEDLLLCMRTFN